jgi:hypothetical protein
MRRYEDIPVIKDDNGRRHYKSVIINNVPFAPEDIYVRTGPGDRLDTLAFDFYGEVKYWWVIASANKLGLGSTAIPPGSQLRIPANPQTYVSEFNKANQ